MLIFLFFECLIGQRLVSHWSRSSGERKNPPVRVPLHLEKHLLLLDGGKWLVTPQEVA
jgi:hypothetical protein